MDKTLLKKFVEELDVALAEQARSEIHSVGYNTMMRLRFALKKAYDKID